MVTQHLVRIFKQIKVMKAKGIMLAAVAGFMLVSCGPTPEEIAAIEALESQIRAYETDLRLDSISINHWRGVLRDETLMVDTRLYAGAELRGLHANVDLLKAQLAEAKFNLATLK